MPPGGLGMIRRTLGLLVCLAIMGMQAEAKPRKFKWWLSVAAVVAASAFDAGTSWGRPEMNPLLRGADGRFAFRGLTIKMSIAGGVAAAQHFALRREPRAESACIATNSAIAGVFTAAAVRNLRITNSRGAP